LDDAITVLLSVFAATWRIALKDKELDIDMTRFGRHRKQVPDGNERYLRTPLPLRSFFALLEIFCFRLNVKIAAAQTKPI
jgi:hypothetical protein